MQISGVIALEALVFILFLEDASYVFVGVVGAAFERVELPSSS